MMMINEVMQQNKLLIPLMLPIWIVTEIIDVSHSIISKNKKPDSFYFLKCRE